MREAMIMASGGVIIGIAAAFLLTRWLVSQLLFDTSPHDSVTFLTAAAVLTFVSLAAAYVPARRATRVDPIVALRAESGNRPAPSGSSMIGTQPAHGSRHSAHQEHQAHDEDLEWFGFLGDPRELGAVVISDGRGQARLVRRWHARSTEKI